MSLQVSVVPTSLQNGKQNNNRQSADYHPTIWGDHFLSHASCPTTIDAAAQQEHEELKQEVRRMLTSTSDKYSQKLSLIDVVQRLGVAYHFEKEIGDELEKLYQDDCHDNNNLNTVALRFRLLRQQGYNVPSDIFSKFKDENGKFKSSLVDDVMGMLSLYEAAHLGIHGDDVLDEAIDFTTSHLKSRVTQVSPHLAKHVTHALNSPFHKGVPRLESRHFIDFCSVENPENKKLLKFAKLDFNMVQAQHQKELSILTQWWKSLDFATKMPYARDRLVELYFWMMGLYFEPHYSLARMIITKVIALLSILNDTYDVYGTVEELEILTDAIKRWNISAIDILPEYMKPLYQALIDVLDEVEEEISKEGRSYCVDYAREQMKRQVQGYFLETKWVNEGYVPTMVEYMRNSIVTSGYKTLATASLLGIGAIANKQVFDWFLNDPKIVLASATISRLMNDIVSREREQKRKHVASAVECYMKQHCISEEEAIRLLKKEISSAWKDVNQDMLKPTAVPVACLERVLNLTRTCDFMYKQADYYTNSYEIKDKIASLFVNPIPL